VPDWINTSRQRLGFHEDAGRRSVEVKAQGRAKPTFHLLPGNDSLVPVAENLRGTAISSWHHLGIVAPQPGKLGVVAIERLIADMESEALFSPWNPSGFDPALARYRQLTTET
jgi:hypothetical protein